MGTYSTHCAALMNRLITLKVYDVYVLIYGKRASLYFLPRFTSQLFRQSEPSNYASNLWFLKGKWQTRRRHVFHPFVRPKTSEKWAESYVRFKAL